MPTDIGMGIEDVVHIYTWILFSHKMNKTMLSSAAWMDLGIAILS